MISHHRGLASLGLVLTLGVTCCMATALVFLPALLRVLSDRGRPEQALNLGRPVRAA
jgi:predicted RND superfamily exporter protein